MSIEVVNLVPKDLVSCIVGILEAAAHPDPSGWSSKVHPDAMSHHDESIRRFQINQYWRTALSAVDLSGQGNTIGARFCLIEDGTIEDWLRLFEKQVVPVIMKHRIGFPLH